jgi:hypothetical protein
MHVTVTQYLVLTGEPIQILGLHRQLGDAPNPKTPCKGKQFTEETLHGNEEESR